MCGSRTEAMQKNKNILKSLAAAVHKNKCNAAGISKKTVHLSSTYKIEVVPVFIYLFIILSSSYVYVSVYVFCTEQQHIDFAVAAGMQYLIGDRCLVVLSIYRQDSNFCSTSKFYN